MKKIMMMALLFMFSEYVYAACTLVVTPTLVTTTIPKGQSTILGFTISGGTAPYTITWPDGFTQTLIAAGAFSRTVAPIVTTTYAVQVTDSSLPSCLITTEAVVNVLPCSLTVLPEISTIEAVSGQSQTISLTIVGGTAPYTVAWSDGVTQAVSAAGAFSRTVIPSVTTLYTVTTTDANGCVVVVLVNLIVALTRIVLAQYDSTDQYTIVSVYLPSGLPDTSFNRTGQVIVSTIQGPPTVLIQPDDKILVTGTASFNQSNNYVMARFNVNGTPDTSFGINGILTIPINAYVYQTVSLWPVPGTPPQ